MKSNYKTLIVVAIGILVIIIAAVYVVIDIRNKTKDRQNETPEDDEDKSNDFSILKQQNQQLLKSEVVQELKSFKMKKRVIIKGDDMLLVKKKDDFAPISDYQKYVTPNNLIVTNHQTSNGLNTAQLAYDNAVKWTWVSDSTLHGTPEKWILPYQFIQDTPDKTKYPNNPVNGMASDCESQAYTLVSILEALGTSKSNVRVVVGKVNFSGEIGGHAWVQLYENGEWFELEATSGPFWDDDDQKLVNNIGFSFNYFKTHPYPVEEYWAYFNDRYYYNPHSNKRSPDLPSHWLEES